MKVNEFPDWIKTPMAWYSFESLEHQKIAQHMRVHRQDPNYGDWIAFGSKVLPLSWEKYKACKQFCDDVVSGKKELPTDE